MSPKASSPFLWFTGVTLKNKKIKLDYDLLKAKWKIRILKLAFSCVWHVRFISWNNFVAPSNEQITQFLFRSRPQLFQAIFTRYFAQSTPHILEISNCWFFFEVFHHLNWCTRNGHFIERCLCWYSLKNFFGGNFLFEKFIKICYLFRKKTKLITTAQKNATERDAKKNFILISMRTIK